MSRPSPKPIKSELHHWWPRTLSKYWGDDDGMCCRLAWDGKLVRSNPANFGAMTNAHHIRHGSEPTPWDGSIEGQFSAADDKLTGLVEELSELSSLFDSTSRDFVDRLLPQLVSDKLIRALCEGTLSLVLRSPRFRYMIESSTLGLQASMGMRKPSVDDALISSNVNGRLKQFGRGLERRGKWLVMFSDEREFIFGDGFLHNYSTVSAPPLSPRILLPLTPTIALLFTSPQRYPSRPRLLTLRVTKDEVSFINGITQAYSCDCIFYRSDRPTDVSLLERHEYQQFPHDKHPWIDALISGMMQFHDPERRAEELALDKDSN